MSVPERRAMVERPGENLSVRRQCALLNLARSGVYRPGPVDRADDLALMRRIDELHLKWPFYGSRRMVFELNQAGHGINRKRVQRLMRVMGIEALVPRPGTSKAAPGHRIYPYLLRGVASPSPIMSGPATSPTSRWRRDFCIWWRLSIGPAGRFWRGVCRTRWIGAFASRRSTRRWSATASRKYSTPIRARSSPAPPSPQARGSRRRDFDGRTRPFHGQHFHRTAVALDQVRRGASESLCRRARGARRHRIVDELLQSSPPTSGDEQPDSHGGMARRHGQIEAAKTVDMPLRLDNANALPTYPQQTQSAAGSCLI